MNVDFSNPVWVIVLIAVVGLILVIMIGVMLHLRKRKKVSAELREKFGSEYDREVVMHGSERKAEAKLTERETRVDRLKIRELGDAQRERFLRDWALVQSRFVDHPTGSVTEADELISAILLARGYPLSGFEQNAEDISVDHPLQMEMYRAAHAIVVRSGVGEASTEELRAAMIQYRTLFDELVQVDVPLTQRLAS